MHKVALSSTTAATAPAAFNGSVTAERHDRGQHGHRQQGHGVLQRRGRPEVHAGAEPLLVDPARGEADQRDEQEQHDGVDSADGEQPSRAGGQHREDTEDQGADPRPGQALAEERRRRAGR